MARYKLAAALMLALIGMAAAQQSLQGAAGAALGADLTAASQGTAVPAATGVDADAALPATAAAAAADPLPAADPLADIPAPKPAATKPAAKPKPAAADTWEQPDGFVPGVDATPTVKPPRASADNSWAITDPSTGTPSVDSVFVDPKFAPKPAGAAAAAPAVDPLAGAGAAGAAAAAPAPVGVGAAGVEGMNGAAGLGGGFGGSLGGAGSSAGGLGGGALGSSSAAASSGDGLGSVFTGASDDLPNTYKPSVANALGSNDLLLKMAFANSQQQLVPVADKVLLRLANITGMPPRQVYYYQTATKDVGGQPNLDVTILFKNNGPVERARQQQLINPDLIQGLGREFSVMGLRLLPGTRTSSPVQGGGATMDPTAGLGLPSLNGTDALGGFVPAPAPAAAAVPEAAASPPPKSSAGGVAVQLAAAAMAAVAAAALL